MNTERRTAFRAAAFTLIELMVVISIMALLSALVVGLAKHASDAKRLSRVKAEMAKWVVMIDNYHDKLGYYPPCNPTGTYSNVATPLYYELCGAQVSADGNTYTDLRSRDMIDKSAVAAVFGVNGLVNASADKGEAVCFGNNIQPGDIVELTLPGQTVPVKLPRVPVVGPMPWGLSVTNIWHYDSKNPTRNPKTYDLWAEIIVGGRTNIIGNWKQ